VNDSPPGTGPRNRGKIALVVVVAALVILSMFFVTAGDPFVTAKTPLWVYHAGGTINSVSVSQNGSYIAVGVGFNLTNLLWEHPTSRIIGQVSISANGSRIEASGYQLSSGEGQAYEDEAVYALESNGSLLWNRTASVPWSAALSPDGSKVTIVGTESVALLTWEGQVLWNYTAAGFPTRNNTIITGPPTYFMSQNGTRLQVGSNGITSLGSGGNTILVKDAFPAYSESEVIVPPNGVQVATPTSALVNSTLLLMTAGTVNSVLAEAVSNDGSFAAAATGLSGQGGTGHPSALYFFSTAGNGSLVQGLEDKLTSYSQSATFILFEIGTGVTLIVLFALLLVMFVRKSASPGSVQSSARSFVFSAGSLGFAPATRRMDIQAANAEESLTIDFWLTRRLTALALGTVGGRGSDTCPDTETTSLRFSKLTTHRYKLRSG